MTAFRTCGPCAIELHWKCVADEPNSNFQCVCSQEDHDTFLHPGITGQVYRTERGPRYGPMRDVDYDLEPYETRRQTETGATKSKPRDDLDAATEVQTKYQERQKYGRF